MKFEKFFSGLISTLLAFVVAYSGLGCLESAFPTVLADMELLAWICAGSALFCTVCFSFRKGGWVFLSCAALAGGIAFTEGTVLLELEALLNSITRLYSSGYGWVPISWSGAELADVAATGGLALLGILITAAVAWTLCRCDYSVTALVPGFVPLAFCLVLTDTVPDAPWLFWLLTSVALILLTHPVRYRCKADGIRLTAWLLIPVFLFSVLIFGFFPESLYDVQSDTFQQTLFEWFNQLPFVQQGPLEDPNNPSPGVPRQTLDLLDLGPKNRQHYSVMDVISPVTDMLYLRGQALDVYTGTNWAVSDAATGKDPYWPTFGLIIAGTLEVSLRQESQFLYFPYYVSDGFESTQFKQGTLPNPENQSSYSLPLYRPLGSGAFCDNNEITDLYRQCLTLPEDTAQWAEAYLANYGLHQHLSLDMKLANVLALVSGIAEYDLDADPMPKDETDFVRWFMEESDAGYCTHYASAATVLLRALGIPARLATGYAIQAEQDTPTTVTADRAHAWVEYLDPQSGWTVFDPTPSEWVLPPSTVPPTEPTDPPETTTPTEPTETTQPTDPTETTQPTESTAEPTRPTESTSPPASTGTAPSTGTTALDSSGDTPAEAPREVDPRLLQALTAVGILMAAFGLLTGQYFLRRRHRRKVLRSGNPNRQALARWRYASRLRKLLKLPASPELWKLAEKAMFSQHALTEEELDIFDQWIFQAHRALNQAPWPKRLLLKLIFAIG